MGAGRHRRQGQRGVVGFCVDAGSMAQGRRRPRRGAGEAGLSGYACRPRSTGSGAYPLADGIAEFSKAPFLRDPGRYRFCRQGKRRVDGKSRETPMLDRTEDISIAAENWLAQFESALASSDDILLKTLFHPDSYWRDVLALSWSLQTINGGDATLSELKARAASAVPRAFQIDPNRAAPRRVTRAGTNTIEAIFRFETAAGRGSGILRLIPDTDDGNRLKAWTLLTALDELKGFEEALGRSRPRGQAYSRDFRGPNWLDLRKQAAEYAGRDPTVLVVGGGQAGLSIAARLRQLQVDTLIVDRELRVGDNWRNRYHALTLHNQVQVNHLPYMPFPPNWPVYIPKDKLANWFEAYVDAMELNYWTGTEFESGAYDDTKGRWSLVLRRTHGSMHKLHPRHVVMPTGARAIPTFPDIPTLTHSTGLLLPPVHPRSA